MSLHIYAHSLLFLQSHPHCNLRTFGAGLLNTRTQKLLEYVRLEGTEFTLKLTSMHRMHFVRIYTVLGQLANRIPFQLITKSVSFPFAEQFRSAEVMPRRGKSTPQTHFLTRGCGQDNMPFSNSWILKCWEGGKVFVLKRWRVWDVELF